MYNSRNKQHVCTTVEINTKFVQQLKNPPSLYNSTNKQSVCPTVQINNKFVQQ